MCEQSLGKGIKTFGVTDYTNLVPLKCCGWTDILAKKILVGFFYVRFLKTINLRMDRQSGPTTKPISPHVILI